MILRQQQDQSAIPCAPSRSEEYTVGEAEPDRWDRLLTKFPSHTIFHTLPWLQTIETVHKARLILAKVNAARRCVAVWPIFLTRKGPLRIVGSPLPGWSTAYLGPLFRPNCSVDQALALFLGTEHFSKGAYFACKVLNDGHHVDLTPFGFTEALKFETYCVDLTLSPDALWNNLKSECRSRVRKAAKLGLEVRQEEDSSFLDEYWTMSIETFANTHIQPTFTREFVQEMWRRLSRSGQVRALSAWLDGERIAMLVLPFDHHTMYYWGGASYLRHRSIPAHNLLQWKAIELAQELGLQRYDFISTLGGAGRFKRTFGPQTLHSATHWERTSSPLMRALKNGYEQFLMRRQRTRSAKIERSATSGKA
ncbi:MAG: GNAT family N-acetyltransferase [Phycisphaerales bacterium]|nr:GNAT family N-acetyltransferase [Phycisphaerales bacterium]MCI0629780.1 GNAT family N-acetyltransferase [Phycisphaerales bacterium]MCI0676515.1 GNAT family N-acetyltransferase [Phycisphaerales bacterium]